MIACGTQATPVHFRILENGALATKSLTISPDPRTNLQNLGGNIEVLSVLKPTIAGDGVVNIPAGDWIWTIQGMSKQLMMSVPDTTVTLEAATISKNLPTYLYTNNVPPVSWAILAGKNILIVTNNPGLPAESLTISAAGGVDTNGVMGVVRNMLSGDIQIGGSIDVGTHIYGDGYYITDLDATELTGQIPEGSLTGQSPLFKALTVTNHVQIGSTIISGDNSISYLKNQAGILLAWGPFSTLISVGGGNVASISAVDGSASFASSLMGISASGDVTAASFTGSGAGLANIPASAVVGLATNLPAWAPSAISADRRNCWLSFNDWVGNYNYGYITNLAVQWRTNGMQSAGFDTFQLDDGWQASMRDGSGNLQANPTTMTNGGIPALVTYLHGLGYKVTIYTSYAPSNAMTCLNNPGTSDATAQQDINLFASWGVDGIMFDSCGGSTWNDLTYAYSRHEFQTLSNAFANVSPTHTFWRFIICPEWPLPPETGSFSDQVNMWGSPGSSGYLTPGGETDIVNTLEFMIPIATQMDNSHFGVYGEAIGSFTYHMDDAVYKFGMTACAIASSPMRIAGLYPWQYQYFTNSELNAIVRDSYTKPGTRIVSNGFWGVWSKPIGWVNSGTNYLALINTTTNSQSYTVSAAALGWTPGNMVSIRDLWAHTNLLYVTNATFTVPGTNCAALLVWKSFPPSAGWDDPTPITTNWPASAVTNSPLLNPIVEFLGDSISSSNGVTGAWTWPHYLTNGLGFLSGAKAYFWAIPGNPFVSLGGQYATNGHTVLPAAGQTDFSFVLAGINDQSATSSQLVTAFTNIATLLHADGKRVVAFTIYPKTSAPLNTTNQTAYNAWLKTATNYWDYLVPLADRMDVTNMLGDGLHPNAEGAKFISLLTIQAILAGQIPTADNSFVSTMTVSGAAYAGSVAAGSLNINSTGYGPLRVASSAGVGGFDALQIGPLNGAGPGMYSYQGVLTLAGGGNGFQWNNQPPNVELASLSEAGLLSVYASNGTATVKLAGQTGTVTATNFVGSLAGNASTATLAANAQAATSAGYLTGTANGTNVDFTGVNLYGDATRTNWLSVSSGLILTSNTGYKSSMTLGGGVLNLVSNSVQTITVNGANGNVTASNFTGNGASLTNLSASNIASGTNTATVQFGALGIGASSDGTLKASQMTPGGNIEGYLGGSSHIMTSAGRRAWSIPSPMRNTSGVGTALEINSTFGAPTVGMNGVYRALSVVPTYNETSSTGQNTDLFISRTETAIGSGPQYLIAAMTASATNLFTVDTGGNVAAKSVSVASGVFTNSIAIPTNSAPTGVTLGVTPPDEWLRISNALGQVRYMPVWTNH